MTSPTFEEIKKGFPATIPIPDGLEKFCAWYATNLAFKREGMPFNDWLKIKNDAYEKPACTMT
jgi:hypothetical protein